MSEEIHRKSQPVLTHDNTMHVSVYLFSVTQSFQCAGVCRWSPLTGRHLNPAELRRTRTSRYAGSKQAAVHQRLQPDWQPASRQLVCSRPTMTASRVARSPAAVLWQPGGGHNMGSSNHFICPAARQRYPQQRQPNAFGAPGTPCGSTSNVVCSLAANLRHTSEAEHGPHHDRWANK